MHSQNFHCKIQCGCVTRYYVVTYWLPIRRSIRTPQWKHEDCEVMVAW